MVSSSVANILSILIPWPLSQTLMAKLNSGGRGWWEIHQKRWYCGGIGIPASIWDIIHSRLVNACHVPDSVADAGVPGEGGSVATRMS